MNKFLLTVAMAGVSTTGVASDAVPLRSGILVDATTQSAMIMLPDGGIASIDINSGEDRWTSTETGRPLSIRNGVLLSQTSSRKGQLSLTYLSTSNGTLLEQISLPVDEAVSPAVVNGPEFSFNIRAVTHNGRDQLQWQFVEQKRSGQLSIDDVLTGRGGQPSALSNQNISGLIDVDFSSRSVLVNRNQSASLEAKQVQREQTLLPNLSGRQFLSEDDQFVLVSTLKAARATREYQWSVYERNGTLVGQTLSTVSYSPFMIIDNTLLFIEPAAGKVVNGSLKAQPSVLRALDLSNGQSVWQRVIRAIRYTGPMPV